MLMRNVPPADSVRFVTPVRPVHVGKREVMIVYQIITANVQKNFYVYSIRNGKMLITQEMLIDDSTFPALF